MVRTRVITEKQIAKALTPDKSVELAKEAYFRMGRGETVSPDRVILSVPNAVSVYCMPAYVKGRSTVSVKIARANMKNQEKFLPTVMARINVYNSETGEELAQLEAETLTAMRTAASSAVATSLLAREDSHVLGLFGTGEQSKAHLAIFDELQELDRILVYSRDRKHRSEFVKQMQDSTQAKVTAVDSPGKVLDGSDILVLATNSNVPLFDGKLVKSGTHVNAIGSALPNSREVDSELVRRSLLVVDSKSQALSSYGDIMIPLRENVIDESQILEIGALVANPGVLKRRKDEISLFKAGGVAVLDAIFADYLLTTT